ncbi:MAG: sulfatase-like hydrolase/transferase [Planctomycetota bacterium]
MPTRRAFLKTTALGAAAMATTSPARRAAAAPKDKPNVLFIMVDDLGKEWVSCCGAEDIETPHLDKLAETGMRFVNGYSMAQCTPSRATLLTGQYPWRHGWVNHWDVPRWGAGCHFDPKHNLSFARVMKSAGYACAIAGKWQINDFRVQPDILEAHGFDDWCMWTGGEGHNPPSHKRYWDPYIHTRAGSKTYKGKFGPDLYADFLIDFMKHHRDRPMMLYYPMCLTHGPLVHTPAAPKARGKMDRHKAMVRYTDHLVGRLVKALDDLGLRDRTIVIFTTDNGSGRGITGRRNGRKVRGAKGRINEPGLCQPFLVNGPGLVPGGVVTEALTDFSDLLPTFAELAGARLPEDYVCDGHSIAKVILGQDKDGPRDWIMGMGHGPAVLDEKGVRPRLPYAERAVRDKRYKLWVQPDKPHRLYDLDEDPAETNDLYDSTAPQVVAARKKLEAVVASFPEKDARPRYDPTPPQPWDRKPRKRKRKRGKNR